MSEYLDKHAPLSESDARFLVYQIGQAMQALHPEVLQPTSGLREIIHRDIKPDNFLIQETPNGPLLKLADFGYAKFVE